VIGVGFSSYYLGSYGWVWPSPFTAIMQVGTYNYIAAAQLPATSAADAGPLNGNVHPWRGFMLGIGLG
jgi:hydrogenase/urease accessory protein HupE